MFPFRILRRRSALITTAAVAGVVLCATLADLAVAAHSEQEIATAFRQATGAPVEPEVRVDGFPVTAQLAHGSLDHVDVSARGIPANDERPVPITRLDVQLEGLTAPGDAEGARSRSASATAFLSYRDLSDSLGLEIQPAGTAGRVGAEVHTPLGKSLQVSAAVKAGPGNAISFEDVEISGDSLPEGARRLLTAAFDRPIPLQNVPGGLHLTSLSTGQDGLKAHFEGKDVSFEPSSTTA